MSFPIPCARLRPVRAGADAAVAEHNRPELFPGVANAALYYDNAGAFRDQAISAELDKMAVLERNFLIESNRLKP
jgi:hypothetical protein